MSAATTGAAADRSLSRFYEQRLSWQPAQEQALAGLETAAVRVPLDYEAPAQEIDVFVARLRASDPSLRTGVLLVGPDDPGNSGAHLVPQLARSLPPDLLARFDVVGFDHRFSGHSTPFTVGLGQEERFWIFHHPASFDDEVAFQANIAARAADRALDVLPHLTSRNIARDMDVIRAALGEERVSYLGYSYGSYLGAVYTQLFGDRADRVVLDSNIPPDWVWRNLFLTYAESVEQALSRWSEWVAADNPAWGLGDSPEQVRATFDELVSRASRQPVELPGLPMPMVAPMLRLLAMILLSSDRSYRFLADVVRAGARGQALDPMTMESLGAVLAAERDEHTAAAQLSILCGDWAWPRDLDVYERGMEEAAERFPFMGAALAGVKAGAFWPVTPREPATPIGPDNPAASILLVQAEHDMFTAASGARRLRELLPRNSRLLMLSDTAEHRVFPFRGSAAVNEHVTDYLLSGRLPDSDVICPSHDAQEVPS